MSFYDLELLSCTILAASQILALCHSNRPFLFLELHFIVYTKQVHLPLGSVASLPRQVLCRAYSNMENDLLPGFQ